LFYTKKLSLHLIIITIPLRKFEIMSPEANTQLIEELNDLVQIQNDRVSGYENALKDVSQKNTDLQKVFRQMIDTSIKHRNELSQNIISLGGAVTEGTTISGKLYRAWMDIKATFTGKDRENVLENCVYGEEAAQKAYDMALASDAEISVEVKQMLSAQQQQLKNEQMAIVKLEHEADKMN
jgi:uncharacterized protein (TIGR02284 family)